MDTNMNRDTEFDTNEMPYQGEGDQEADADEYEYEEPKRQRASCKGRRLMRWNPDIDQYLLLAVEVVSNEVGSPINWELVGRKVNQYITGEGIKQHLAKLRKHREENELPVPQKRRKGQAHPEVYGTGISNAPGKKVDGVYVGPDTYKPPHGKGATLLWTDPKLSMTPKRKKQAEAAEEEEESWVTEPSSLGAQVSRAGTEEAMSSKAFKAKKKAFTPRKNTNDTNSANFTEPKTPSRGRKAAVKAEGEEKTGRKMNPTKSTGKRGRGRAKKSTPQSQRDETEDELEDQGGSPSKKFRRTLRPTYAVNYVELAGEGVENSEDDDAVKDEDFQSQPRTGLKTEATIGRAVASEGNMPSAPPPKMDLFSKLAGHADLQSNEAGGYEGQAHTPRLDDNMFAVTSDGYGYDIGSSGLPDPMQTYGTNSDGVSSNYGSFDSNHATFGSNSSDFSAYDFSSFGGSVYRGPDGNEWHNGYPVGPSTPVQAAMDMSQALQTPFYTMGEQASTAVPRVMDFNGKTSSKKKKKSKKTSSGMPQDSGSNKAKQEDLNMPLPKYQSNNTEMQSLHGDGMINIANNKGHMSGYGAPASHAHPVRNFSLPNLPIYQGASYPPTTTNEESNALAVWPSNSQRSDASFTTDLADLHVGNDNRLFSENFSTAPGLITANDMPDWASDRADYDFDGSITTYNHHDTYNKLYGSNGQRYYAPVQDANVSVPSYANAFIYSDDQAMPTINHDDNLTALGFAQDDEDSKKAHRKL